MKNTIFKFIKYFFFFFFFFASLNMFNTYYMIDKAYYKMSLFDADDIKTKPKDFRDKIVTKDVFGYESPRPYVYVNSDEKGFQKIKTDFLGINILKEAFILVDNKNMYYKVRTKILDDRKFDSYLNLNSNSFEYIVYLIDMKLSLSKNFDNSSINTFFGFISLFSFLSIFYMFFYFIFLIYKKIKSNTKNENKHNRNILIRVIPMFISLSFYSLFTLSILVAIYTINNVDKPSFVVIKGDNIRTGPSSKHDIIRTIKPQTFRKVYVSSDKKGWQELKTDFLGVNIFQKSYIWIGKKSTMGTKISAFSEFYRTSYFTVYINGFDYLVHLIELKLDLSKKYDDKSLDEMKALLFIMTFLSYIFVLYKIINFLFRRKSKDTTNEIKNNNSSTSNQVNQKTNKELEKVIKKDYLDSFKKLKNLDNQLVKKSILENKSKKCLKEFFNKHFNLFDDDQIIQVKNILGIDLNYSIEDAVKNNDYEVFNMLVKMELIKIGDKK